MRLEAGQVAVVTGAASGIGRGLAEGFLRRGLAVVAADVEATALDEAGRRDGNDAAASSAR
jgi:NAD(P)-dependent dehydrogenase (short-subunit alcohol dehydrogenase family)